MSRLSHSAVTAARAGRVLVECCVSLVLLAGGSTLVLLVASTTAQVVDDARQRDLVLQEQQRAASLVWWAPCLASAGPRVRAYGPRTMLRSEVSISGRVYAIQVEGQWRPSGLGAVGTRVRRSSTAGWCE